MVLKCFSEGGKGSNDADRVIVAFIDEDFFLVGFPQLYFIILNRNQSFFIGYDGKKI